MGEETNWTLRYSGLLTTSRGMILQILIRLLGKFVRDQKTEWLRLWTANSKGFFANLHRDDLSVNDGLEGKPSHLMDFLIWELVIRENTHAVPFVLFHLVSPLNMFEPWPEIIERTKSRMLNNCDLILLYLACHYDYEAERLLYS